MQTSFTPFEYRLTDAIEHLIDLKSSYFDPGRFRRTLNATIESLRNVTFVLQKCGSQLDLFESWYKPWQETLRKDRILKWLVDSRNKVVKEGDLETHSIARIKLYRDWYEPPVTTTEVSPNLSPNEYALRLSEVIPENLRPEEALLHIERRWVDQEFSEYEIVELLDHCADVLLKLANSLSENFQISFNSQLNDTVERWKNSEENFRSCWLKLSNGEFASPEFLKLELDKEILEQIPHLYNAGNEDLVDIPLHTPFQEQCGLLFKQALAVLRRDNCHLPIVLLISKNQDGQILGVPMDDRAEKHLQMRWIAEQVSRHPDPYAVIFVSEAWVASSASQSYRYASDDSNRREALAMYGLTCEGECFTLFQLFERIGEKVWFPSNPRSSVEFPNIMLPIYDKLLKK